jgi:hypothetical protein
MAEMVMKTAGQAIGQRVLPQGVKLLGKQLSGSAIGRFLGSTAGRAIDAALFAPRIEGPRLKELFILDSREGAPIETVFGRMRVAGQVIWASRLKETRSSTGGGKGGPRLTEHTYTISFAVGLGTGPIARIARVWANGAVFDLSKVTWRLYAGTPDQSPDPLILTLEGQAPAYRDLAYIVFEDFPLNDFGGRMPQLSFEVIRPVGSQQNKLEDQLRAVNLIPGSGEFALGVTQITRRLGYGSSATENVNNGSGQPDALVSLDQLEADFPNVRHVNLIVGWFGTDLRASQCQIRPGVERRDKSTEPRDWRCGDTTRNAAHLISTDADGRPAYGGSPDDRTVIDLIGELKRRGFTVTLYPFLFMDIPPGNGFTAPDGTSPQPAYPWRGRIGVAPSSVTGTAAVRSQSASFFGTAGAGDFSAQAYGPNYHGPDEWSYRRFILHYAKLGAQAGIDSFLIGSEMVGLTHVPDETGGYPFVAGLIALAAEARALLGAGVEISYAADWTEYGASLPEPGALAFPLDPLWASPNVDFVGLDWYPPLTDWREATRAQDLSDDALQAGIEGGEGYDGYYPDAAARLAGTLQPITDGAYQEPWVYRPKDIRNWWKNAHHPRLNGVRASVPTAWVPGSKPIRLVEFGCPAVDKGGNAPNVFYDPASSESALPPFSTGARDDFVQRRVLEAFLAYWDDPAHAEMSALNGKPMLSTADMAAWCWDLRPFPDFPGRSTVWGDGGNWRLGHWLNGRGGLAPLGAIVTDLCRAAGLDLEEIDTRALGGIVPGFAVPGGVDARSALTPLMEAFGLQVHLSDGRLVFSVEGEGAGVTALDKDTLIGPAPDLTRVESRDCAAPPARLWLSYIDSETAHLPRTEQAHVQEHHDEEGPSVSAELAVALDAGQASVIASRLLAGALGPAGSGRAECPGAGTGRPHQFCRGKRSGLDDPGSRGGFCPHALAGPRRIARRCADGGGGA